MKNNLLNQTQIGILDFWHKIEFFLPYDLQETLSNIKKQKHIYSPYTLSQIGSFSATQLWTNPYQGKDDVVVGFELFIGIYNKDELAKQLKEMLSLGENSENVRFIGNTPDNRNLGEEGKGLSCCAKISLDEFGRLDPYKSGNIEVSTAPWAIGQIRTHNGDVSCLDFNKFDGEMKLLKENIARFLQTDIAPQITEENPIPALNGENLTKLVELVTEWMNFQTDIDSLPHFYLYPRKGKKSKKENTSHTYFVIEAESIQISIMNSFFATDIAKVIRAAKQQLPISSPLIAYLSQAPQYIDLYHSLEGKQCIIEHLKPEYINQGHWFSENQHHMSLMQQFAINTIFKESDKNTQSLFSVNGPPGTGKTTLLRDIFAENIVRRASKLASYADVKSTFKNQKLTVEFGKTPLELSVLQDDLTGYEMVVTSSNNAAVQNISEELPQVKALGKNWLEDDFQPKVTYLQTVARNLTACKKTKKKKVYIELEPKNDPWGLIACVLGRKDKRDFFVEQFGRKPDEEAEGYKEEYFDYIFSWRKKYSGLSFIEAKKQFLSKKQSVEQHIQQLTEYMQAELLWQEQQHIDFNQDINQAKIALDHTLSHLEMLKQENALIALKKPNIFTCLFFPRKKQAYIKKLEENYKAQSQYQKNKSQIEEKLLSLQEKQYKKQNLAQKIETLRKQFEYHPEAAKSKVKVPVNMLENLEQDFWQISGFWSDENLNQKRAELFQAALVLHEAWLSECINKELKNNILALNNLLSGQSLQGDQKQVEAVALVIWQTLFMMVPVASTTFASFGSLFRYLGTQSLGWVFVDEAGQAIPQAAVGALWRAKKAVIVGDPLQIEPVFTTPEKLTDMLLKASIADVSFEVAPHKTSVQVLADKANPYGAKLSEGAENVWIGSPLRVHRRCFEPMFTIANRIAYQGKMVFGLNKTLPDSDPWLMEKSAWLHLAENDKQMEQEVTLVYDIFRQLCLQKYEEQKLPPVYIISPFKELCEKIRASLIANQDLWDKFDVSGKEWTEKNVGTVHTFQGKENSIVFLVLGRNQSDIGKAAPLVTKPNLLNVAATRAKDRFFIIGDYYLWKEKYECFKQASPVLNNMIDASSFFNALEQRVKEARKSH